MGMSDSVIANCPECSAEIEFQSKAGPCNMYRYHSTSVPAEIAVDLNEEYQTERCEGCGTEVRLSAPVPRVSMAVSGVFRDEDGDIKDSPNDWD